MTVGQALTPGPLEDSPVPGVRNPVGVGDGDVVGAVALTGWTTLVISIVLGGWSLVRRYRRSHGVVRQQLRWVALSALVFLGACMVSVALYTTSHAGVGQVLVLVAFSLIPVAAAVAILRYRLYDIDVVIRRTLVYGSLTAVLAAAYLGSVLVLRLLLTPVTGDSDVAVAGSTLAVAALFRPARARVQGVVDRRFYRRRYDAVRTLETFTACLRDELDLEAVGRDLRAAVRDTVAPTHVSLWVRP
jgi:hypothetical protein